MGKGVVYITVMNNLSVDCDGHPSAPQMKDIGILASLDPVTLDKACLDLVYNHSPTAGDNNQPLMQCIDSRHGTHIVDYAGQIGSYELIDITDGGNINNIVTDGISKYNVYDLNGKKIRSNASSLSGLTPGIYIINGQTITIKKVLILNELPDVGNFMT